MMMKKRICDISKIQQASIFTELQIIAKAKEKDKKEIKNLEQWLTSFFEAISLQNLAEKTLSNPKR